MAIFAPIILQSLDAEAALLVWLAGLFIFSIVGMLSVGVLAPMSWH